MNKLFRLFYDLSVYKEIVSEKLRFSLLRYSFAFFCISLILGFWINQKYLPDIIATYTKLSVEVMQQIPPAASFDLKNGALTTGNLPLPFILSLPPISSTPLLYINPQADLTALASTSAFVALGGTHMRTLANTDNTYEVAQYSDQKNLQSFSITGNDIHAAINALSQFIDRNQTLFPFMLTLPIFCFLWVERLVQTLVYALILRVIGSLFNNSYRFVSYWQLTLHTIVVAELINTLILVTYHSNYPFVFTLAFIGTTILAYLHLPAFPKTETK